MWSREEWYEVWGYGVMGPYYVYRCSSVVVRIRCCCQELQRDRNDVDNM
jgi:hypothetical protein